MKEEPVGRQDVRKEDCAKQKHIVIKLHCWEKGENFNQSFELETYLRHRCRESNLPKVQKGCRR